MSKPAQTLESLAEEFYSAFETAKRASTDEEFQRLKDGSPEWMQEAIREAHNGLNGLRLPNDTIYAMCHDVIGRFTDGYDDLEDSMHEICDGLVAVYTADLLSWLADGNQAYCEEAVKELGASAEDMDRLMQAGMYLHYQEIFGSLLQSLKERLDEEDDTEEEELCEACFVPLSHCICAPKEPAKPEEVHFQQVGQPSACGSMSGSFNSNWTFVTCRACYEKREAERDFMDYHRARQAEEVALETQADQSPNTEEN